MLNKEERFSFIFLWEKETKTKIIFRVERKELADFLEVDERYPYHGDENPANLWAFS